MEPQQYKGTRSHTGADNGRRPCPVRAFRQVIIVAVTAELKGCSPPLKPMKFNLFYRSTRSISFLTIWALVYNSSITLASNLRNKKCANGDNNFMICRVPERSS